ncbi:MAG: isoleucine--tRNA ligase [Thermodesulfobacteriota bacterium]
MDYRETLNLPNTEFKMKANLAQREPEVIKAWESENLYARVQAATGDRPPFILHDGPPYANGHIHLGTAFNKILKDIILRSRRMAGHHCPYVPGWDCHGLPIEHNVDKELGSKKKTISKLEFRAECRKYARKWIDTQREEFRRLGVLGDWQEPYLTINYGYEAAIAREFLRFLSSGAVVRSKKPVYWCTSCRTALAEAEVEYHDHASPSIYVKFPLDDDISDVLPGAAKVSLVIWTTTPWTLPANLAVALHPDFTYAAVAAGGEVYVVADGLVERFVAETGLESWEKIAGFPASALAGRHCRHPFLQRQSLIITAPYVTLDAGTGCVHTAPGHGREDYLSGVRYELPILSPVDGDGRFTDEAGPYAGMKITDANERICDDLAASGHLLGKNVLGHSYPHCWRCKRPVIFRATEQWFISMDENGIREKSLAAIREVSWVPKWGMDRIYGMVESRPDWCLSRQRAWGVPITVFLCKKCGAVHNDTAINRRIVDFFEKEGADAWFARPDSDFLGPEPQCRACGNGEFSKEEDILDVWFDSGVSYAAVLEARPELKSPADLYLEGSDQHRGWFQSSLIASVGTRGVPPYRNVLTHGFVVDGAGKKMSKSIGNVIAPAEVVNKYGAEILRLWVASEDYRDDIKISNAILGQLADAYRKIRNTVRFLLGNLADFAPESNRVAGAELTELDRWALAQYELLQARVKRAYDEYDFHVVFHSIYQFCTVTLSALYLDILKDRLYTSGSDSRERRSAQTVLFDITSGLLRLMAPILCFTAAEAWEFLPGAGKGDEIVLALFPEAHPEYVDRELLDRWERLLAVRSEITKALEVARQNKVVGHPLEASVALKVDGELGDFVGANWQTLQVISIVSELKRVETMEGGMAGEELKGISILVTPAPGAKCERCWTRSTTIGSVSEHPTICRRCADVVVSG